MAGGSLPNIKGFEYRQAFIFAWRSFANLFDLGGSRKSPQQRFAAFHFNLVCVRGSFERVWGEEEEEDSRARVEEEGGRAGDDVNLSFRHRPLWPQHPTWVLPRGESFVSAFLQLVLWRAVPR